MGMELGLWRIDSGVERVELGGMPSEEQLEELLQRHPAILGETLLIVGRQVQTRSGKRIDLLAVDSEGALRVLELKRARTPRDAVAQVLEYGAWVQQLSHDEVLSLFQEHNDEPFEQAFERVFGFSSPEEINGGHKLTLIASELDEDSQTIIEYLDTNFGVPINAIFFRYFRDGDHEFLARNYLIDESQEATSNTKRRSRTKEAWNGIDWYVSFDRPWEDARRLGYVSAGGGDWYANTIRNVPEGARVWACIPKTGYVGVGIVAGPAVIATESEFANEPNLSWDFTHENGEPEWLLPVRWIKTVSSEEAVWRKGMFANQNSACKLRNSFTINELYKEFGIENED